MYHKDLYAKLLYMLVTYSMQTTNSCHVMNPKKTITPISTIYIT